MEPHKFNSNRKKPNFEKKRGEPPRGWEGEATSRGVGKTWVNDLKRAKTGAKHQTQGSSRRPGGKTQISRQDFQQVTGRQEVASTK